MRIERGNVPALAPPPGYTHYASVVGNRFVFLAGQVPLDAEGNLVGGDLIAQLQQCVNNLSATLRLLDARPEQAVRTTVYVVASEQGQLGRVWRELRDSEMGGVTRTAATLVGVAQLGYPGQLVEIEVTLALPE